MVVESAPIKFSREIDGEMIDLMVSEDFVMDFHFISQEDLTVILRVQGVDSKKLKEFFKDSKGELFYLKTRDTWRDEIVEGEFLLNDMYMDEGPPISIDIGVQPPMVRLILDFKGPIK